MATYNDSFRDIYQRVTILGTGDVITQGLVSIKISQINSADKTLKMGEFCKNSCKIVYRGEPMSWRGAKIYVESVLNGVASSLGYYFVDSVVFDGTKYTIIAYDLPKSMDDLYDFGNGYTAANDIVNEILRVTGMTAMFRFTDTWQITSVPEGTTNRQMLAYILGCYGVNIRVNGDGELEAYWYTNIEHQIPRSAQYQNQLRQQMELITISSFTTGTQDDPLSFGDGFGIQYWNPYITQAQANQIYNRIYNNSYYVGSVKYRGNPAIRNGDSVSVELADGTYATMYVMAQEFNCDGGMNATITSYGNEQTTATIQNNSVSNKIQILYSGFKDALNHALDGLKNSEDGYYSLLTDENGRYTGWQILNQDGDTLLPTTSGWKWTYNGLVWTNDGFNSVNNIAITNDGHIIGKFITGEFITADLFASSLKNQYDINVATSENVNQWFSFDPSNGLIIGHTDDAMTVSQMKSDGFRILDANDYTNELFSAVASGGESVVTATNFTAKNYLTLDYTGYDGRFEPYGDTFDANQIGFYFIPE